MGACANANKKIRGGARRKNKSRVGRSSAIGPASHFTGETQHGFEHDHIFFSEWEGDNPRRVGGGEQGKKKKCVPNVASGNGLPTRKRGKLKTYATHAGKGWWTKPRNQKDFGEGKGIFTLTTAGAEKKREKV